MGGVLQRAPVAAVVWCRLVGPLGGRAPCTNACAARRAHPPPCPPPHTHTPIHTAPSSSWTGCGAAARPLRRRGLASGLGRKSDVAGGSPLRDHCFLPCTPRPTRWVHPSRVRRVHVSHVCKATFLRPPPPSPALGSIVGTTCACQLPAACQRCRQAGGWAPREAAHWGEPDKCVGQ